MYWKTSPKPVTKLEGYSDELLNTKYVYAEQRLCYKKIICKMTFSQPFIISAHDSNSSVSIGIQSSLLLFSSLNKRNRKHKVGVSYIGLVSRMSFKNDMEGDKEMEEVKSRNKTKTF